MYRLSLSWYFSLEIIECDNCAISRFVPTFNVPYFRLSGRSIEFFRIKWRIWRNNLV
ncbi:hypothetical protein QWZ13_16770 [Reinekea marina]|uniref:hypothetical protein n=1 Tax=Reinekea marina TaxID=1310421 RepID=UPI0025B4E0AA|nr:hypothetical protein [Reinekea marina]MDN3650561.1 hypothetical protein [Reinekea marina]